MLLQIILFAILVQVIGVLSMSMVTGQSVNKTLGDADMMTVFFCTGILLCLLACATVNTETRECGRGCNCDKCRRR